MTRPSLGRGVACVKSLLVLGLALVAAACGGIHVGTSRGEPVRVVDRAGRDRVADILVEAATARGYRATTRTGAQVVLERPLTERRWPFGRHPDLTRLRFFLRDETAGVRVVGEMFLVTDPGPAERAVNVTYADEADDLYAVLEALDRRLR